MTDCFLEIPICRFSWFNGLSVICVSAKKDSESSSCITSQDAVENAQQMKRELLDKLEKLAEDLPPNTLDELIDELGGPDNVAEVGLKLAVHRF